MSECTEPRWNELLGAYALGSCTPGEQQGMREHLRHCPTCTAELLELGAAREALLTTVPRASAPPELKSRVMAQVRADAQLFAAAREREAGNRETPARAPRRARGDRRFGWLRAPVPLAAAAACAAVLALGAGVLGAALVGGDGGSASTRTVSADVDATQAPGASARLVVSDDGGSRLLVRGLPSAGRGRVYQVWLSSSGATRPAGTLFAVDRTGNGEAAVPGSLDGVDQVLVSSEPAGGSLQPTRTPVLAAQV